jgi:hypothetical protein
VTAFQKHVGVPAIIAVTAAGAIMVLDDRLAATACVPFQHFSKGRAIFSPRKILATLRANNKFKRGHPDLQIQYGTPFSKSTEVRSDGKDKEKVHERQGLDSTE